MNKLLTLLILSTLISCGTKPKEQAIGDPVNSNTSASTSGLGLLAECGSEVNEDCFVEYLQNTEEYRDQKIVSQNMATRGRVLFLMNEKVDNINSYYDSVITASVDIDVANREKTCQTSESADYLYIRYSRPDIISLSTMMGHKTIKIDESNSGNSDCAVTVDSGNHSDDYIAMIASLTPFSLPANSSIFYTNLDQDTFIYVSEEDLGVASVVTFHIFQSNYSVQKKIELKYLSLPMGISQDELSEQFAVLDDLKPNLAQNVQQRLFGERIRTQSAAQEHMSGDWLPVNLSLITRRGQEQNISADDLLGVARASGFELLSAHTIEDEALHFSVVQDHYITIYHGVLNHRRHNEYIFRQGNRRRNNDPIWDFRYSNRAQVRMNLPRRITRQIDGLRRNQSYRLRVDFVKDETLDNVVLQ